MFAQYFLRTAPRTLLKVLGATGARSADILSIGLYKEVVRRHAMIDAWLEAALKKGVQQLVILGAGYDSRAWRFARKGLKTFELDQKNTQSRKLACIRQFSEKFSDVQIEFETVDFNKSWHIPKLKQPSVVIWEGVTMYLTQKEVQASLQIIARGLNKESYLFVDILQPDAPMRSAFYPAKLGLHFAGEPLKWSLSLDDAPDYFSSLGFNTSRRISLKPESSATFRRGHIGLIELRLPQ